MYGEQVELSRLSGKAVLLYYTERFPPPYVDTLKAWQAEWGRDRVAILCVYPYRTESWKMLAEKHGNPFYFLLDDGTIHGQYRPYNVESMFLIDPQGCLRYRMDMGRRDSAEKMRPLRAQLAEMLNEPIDLAEAHGSVRDP